MRDNALIWLASYPKSGNTWLRSFLAAYLHPGQPFDINVLDAPIAASRLLLDDCLGVELSDLPWAQVQALLPSAYHSWAAEAPPFRRLVKTHDAFYRTAAGVPIFPPEVTQGVIHIVRDPRDVVISLAHHNGTDLDAAITRLNDPEGWLLKANRKIGAQIPQYTRDWSGHARSWLDVPFPRLLLRYEAMRAEPDQQFAAVIAFCGLTLDASHLRHALEVTAFARLQAQEVAQGFRERPAGASAPFFRSGQAGGWRTVLSPAQAARIVAAHAEVMQRLGYALD